MNAKVHDMSILYVEDDDSIRESMIDFLNRRFEQVLLAENGATGLDLYRKNVPDIVMTDIRMPVMDGLEMTRAILEQNDKAPIIVISAYNEARYLLGAIELGISHYLLKPLERENLDASLRHCIEIVQKARTLSERENSISEAYRTINSLLEYGEQNIINSVSLDTEVERQLDQMIKRFLGCGREIATHSPTGFVMTLTHGLPGDPEWLWYERGRDGTLHKALYPDHPFLDQETAVGCAALYYINEGDTLPDDPLFLNFWDSIAQQGRAPRNLIWYRNGARIICALNYPASVTADDGAMVKNLSVQTRYMDTISAQRHQTEEAFLYTITSLARAAEANDEDNGNHILRVGKYSSAICRQIGYSEAMSNILEQQSQLHDVGKIHISPDILKKPGKLTAAEMTLMREHPLFGAGIIGVHPRLEIARTIALYHHERWNGGGYPAGLREAAIPLDARIVAIADTYDALRSRRSYKPAFDHDSAYRIMCEGDGRTEPSHFDPDILSAFKTIHRTFDLIYERFASVIPISDQG